MTIVEQNNMMNSNGNYPMGAEYDTNAPWNQPEIEYKEVEVTISLTISKTTKVTVPDIEKLDDSILKEAVKEQIVLPYESDLIRSISGNNPLYRRELEDLSNWIVDDFEVVKE